jgi:branched-chain amino acid transport system permease protein
MNTAQFLQASFSGLGAGMVYAVVGMGFVITHRITGVVNFAQGQLAVLGAMGTSVSATWAPLPIAVLIGGLVAAGAGALMYVAAIHPLRSQGHMTQALVTLAVSVLILAGLQLAFGTGSRALAPFTEGGPVRIAGASINYQTLWILVLGAGLALGLFYFFERTKLGVALKACAINRFAAQVVGINVTFMAIVSFALSGFVAALIVSAQAPLTFVVFSAGLTLTLKAFIAAAVAGLQSIQYTLVGGISLGLIEAWSTIFVSSAYQNVIAMSLLFVLLVLRPAGIGRTVVSERV